MEQIIGPLEFTPHNYITNLCLLGFKDNFFYVIKLDLVSQFKYTISLQLPFYSTYFDTLRLKSIKELQEKYAVTRFKIDDNFVLDIKRSRYWKHQILVKIKNDSLKFFILQRNHVSMYESRLLNYKK